MQCLSCKWRIFIYTLVPPGKRSAELCRGMAVFWLSEELVLQFSIAGLMVVYPDLMLAQKLKFREFQFIRAVVFYLINCKEHLKWKNSFAEFMCNTIHCSISFKVF